MGGRKLPRGVTIRTYASGKKAIQVQFQYRAVQCREVLSTVNPELASSIKYAERLKAEIESKIERGTFTYTDYFPDSPRARVFGHAVSSMTVKQAQDALIDDLEAAGREATTIAAYRRSAARVAALIGSIRVSALTPADIRDMLRNRVVSRKTWNNDLIPLRRSLKRALNDGIINYSPLDRVDIDELVPALKRPAPDPFSMAEIDAILDAARAYCEKSGNLYQFAFFTGLRIEELAALQWEDVDLKAERAYITKAAQLSIKSAEPKGTKTEAGERVIDLLPRALNALQRQRQFTYFQGANVFCRWQSLEPYASHDQFRLRWITILNKAGVRHRPLRQSRHTYASHMLSSGERELYVANQMGHKGTSLLDVYATWVDEWKGDYQEKRYGT